MISGCKKTEPIANFNIVGNGGTAPCTILFENSSENATSYEWQFGDGSTSSEESPSHEYITGGTYTVKLTATGEGGQHMVEKQVLIQASQSQTNPVANFTFSGANNPAPCNVSFTNTSSNATSYQWDFGDGSSSTQQNPSHTYTAGGAYSVTLKAINEYGNHTITKIVNIGNSYSSVRITSTTVNSMSFTDDNGSGWDYVDGPDLYLTISDVNTNIYQTSSTVNDLTQSMLPRNFTWSPAYEVENLSDTWYIDLWDADTPDDDDYIGYVGFTMSNYTSGSNPYPSSITVSQNGISLTLYLQWQAKSTKQPKSFIKPTPANAPIKN